MKVRKKVKSFVIGKLKTDIELGNLKLLFCFHVSLSSKWVRLDRISLFY